VAVKALSTRVTPRARPPRVSGGLLVGYLLIALGALFCLAPFYLMLVYATHSAAEIYSVPTPVGLGSALGENLAHLLEVVPFGRNLWNSLYIALLSTAATLFFCSLAGFAFAMYEFRFRELLFSGVLATLLIPGFLNLVPFYLMMNAFGWLNKPLALWLPGAASAFGIFLMRQYIGSTLPSALLEAARIDGCTEFGLYWKIALPLSKPALGALGLVSFVGAWNNFQGALIVMQDKNTATVQLALGNLKGAYNTDWGALFAGSALAVIPLLVLFAVFSKQLIEGLTAGSVKG